MTANDQSGKRLKMVLLILASFSWLVQGCAPNFVDQALQSFYGQIVTVPQRDPTPPVATLKVPSLGSGPRTLITGQPDVTIPLTASQSPFFVIGVADDPEGVKEVDLFGDGVTNCTNGQGVSFSQIGDYPNGVVTSDISPAKPGGTATNRRSVIHQINLDEWTSCGDGFRVTSVAINLQAGGTNFSGLKSVSPTAHFSYKP